MDAHEPLLFTFSTGNADLDETYVVRRGLAIVDILCDGLHAHRLGHEAAVFR